MWVVPLYHTNYKSGATPNTTTCGNNVNCYDDMHANYNTPTTAQDTPTTALHITRNSDHGATFTTALQDQRNGARQVHDGATRHAHDIHASDDGARHAHDLHSILSRRCNHSNIARKRLSIICTLNITYIHQDSGHRTKRELNPAVLIVKNPK
jgi:hypothetical protein